MLDPVDCCLGRIRLRVGRLHIAAIQSVQILTLEREVQSRFIQVNWVWVKPDYPETVCDNFPGPLRVFLQLDGRL